MSQTQLAKLALAFVLLLTIAAGSQLHKLNISYDFESFFPANDPDMQFFTEYRDKFESDNDFVLIGLGSDKGVFNRAFLTQLQALTDSLNNLSLVTGVQSLNTIRNPVIGPLGGLIEIPFLHVNDPNLFAEDSTKIYQEKGIVGTYISADATAVTILLKHKQQLGKKQSDLMVNDLERVLAQFQFDKVHIAGRVHGQLYYTERMKQEIVLFASTSFVLLVLVLFFSFRSGWGIVVPISVVILTIIWLLAVMVITDTSIDIMKTLLPTILFVVGISDVIHIVQKYLQELRNGAPKANALKTAFREVGIATLLTSLTTALGFLTLLTQNIVPIREFGLFTAIGVILAFILAFTLLPGILTLMKKPKVANSNDNRMNWHSNLSALLRWTFSHQKQIMIGAIIIGAIAIFGVSHVKVDNSLLEDLSAKDPLKISYSFFEDEFAGVRPFEMAIIAKGDKNLLSYTALQEIEKLEGYLDTAYHTGFLVSPLTLVKAINRARNGGHKENFKLPENEKQLNKALRTIKRFDKRNQIKSILTQDKMMGRITGKMIDYGGATTKELNQKLRQFYLTNIDTSLIDYKLTGTSMLIDKNNEYLASNMMKGLLIAFSVVALLMGIIYRSPKMVLISLVPNIMPLLLIGGIMGFCGIDLKVSTSIIFTIAFGIAVDDTIHFLSKLKLELSKGKSLPLAIRQTYLSTGKAIIVTSIILSSGFITLIMSDFTGIFYVGSLVSLTLVFAVASDLLLLPILLLKFYKKN